MGQISPFTSLRNWLSTIKWVALSLRVLPSVVENWGELLGYYVLPVRRSSIQLRARLGYVLEIPRSYPFQAIAETTILNVYGLMPCLGQVVVDIGASIGDFTILAAKAGASQVIAFEPDSEVCRILVRNVEVNRLNIVNVENAAANGSTIDHVLSITSGNHVDFLKIDCEGCEMGVLLGASAAALEHVTSIHMETHPWVAGYSLERIVDRLQRSGFKVVQTRGGKPHYLHATRPRSVLGGLPSRAARGSV